MTPQEYAAYASAFQSIIVSIAIGVGGVWALFRYKIFREREKATVDLERQKRELARRVSLQITLRAQVSPASVVPPCLLIKATVHNAGSTFESIDWRKSTLRSARLLHFEDQRAVFSEWSYRPPEGGFSTLEQGETAEFPFVLPIDQPGIYCIEFRGMRAADVTPIHDAHALATGLLQTGADPSESEILTLTSSVMAVVEAAKPAPPTDVILTSGLLQSPSHPSTAPRE